MSIKNLQLDPRILKKNPWNTNIVSPSNETKLEESVKRLGMFKPVIVRTLKDGSYEILGGEHRAAVAIRLGHQEVPVIDLGMISDKKAKEIGLVDNGRFGEDDSYKLSELIRELGGVEEIIDIMPYTDGEIESIFNNTTIALDELDLLDLPSDDLELPTTKPTATHQIMRFKVQNDDVDTVTKAIEKIIKTEGFTESDSLTNAGDALVYLARSH
jgi:ParB family transcriptional regulator, chromosome partitioning protein